MKLNNENTIFPSYYFHGRYQISIIGGASPVGQRLNRIYIVFIISKLDYKYKI